MGAQANDETHRQAGRAGAAMPWRRRVRTACAAAALLAFGGATALWSTAAAARDLAAPVDFEGRMLVSVSDADMVASAYVNGDLGPREGRDALSVIALNGDARDWRAAEVTVSNSVAGPPASVDVTPDGATAFVVETWTQRPDNDEPHTFGDLSFGNRLSVVDLSDPSEPTVLQEVETLSRPDAVRVSSDGRWVAVSFHPSGAGSETPLALYPLDGQSLGEPIFPTIPGWQLNERLIDLDWHPNEPLLALVNETAADVRFMRVIESDGSVALEANGNVVETEKAQYRVEFTPDGRNVIVNALYWGVDVQGLWNEAPDGSLLSIRLNAGEQADGTPRHALMSRIQTSVSPEGLAVSPDGRWALTTNLERSYLPYDDARITWYSSLTLAAIDPETGALTKVGDFTYDGILPEAAAFDASSRYVAIATYDHFDDRREGGSIDFWRVTGDPLKPGQVTLVKTNHSVPVTRGAHSMVLVR